MIGYEETQLGQHLGALAENGELELPNAALHQQGLRQRRQRLPDNARVNAINALTNGEPGTLREMAKHLKRHCDMSFCDSQALPGDIFCRRHREIEDAIILEAQNDLPFWSQ